MSGAQLSAAKSGALSGVVRAPGDKSISHRSLIFGALATGTTTVEGLLEGEDVLRTAGAMRAFGARVEQQGPGRWRVEGNGGFQEPTDVIDCGNAGKAFLNGLVLLNAGCVLRGVPAECTKAARTRGSGHRHDAAQTLLGFGPLDDCGICVVLPI